MAYLKSTIIFDCKTKNITNNLLQITATEKISCKLGHCRNMYM